MYIRKEYLYRRFVDSLLAFVGVSVVYESSILFLSQLILFLWWGKATTGGKEITVDFTNTPWGIVMRDESGIAHERVSETSSHRGDDNSEHSQVVSGPTDESSEHWDAAAHIAPPVRPNTSVVRFSWMSRLYLGPLMSAAVVEFIGTFFLVLTVPLSSLWNSELAPISVGFMLMSMVFSFGYLSGGHINPMVSFSVWLASLHPSATPINGGKKFEKRRLLLYVIAQMAGGSVASLYCLLIYGNGFPVPNMGLDFGVMLRGFLAELVFTFVLCSTVLHVAISKQRSNSFYGFAIGFAVLCGGLTCGSISGGVFNPAIATPLILCRCLFSFSNSGCTPMASLWVYWASELVGSVLATGFYLMTHNAVGES